MSKSIAELQEEVIQEFSEMSDWEERFQYLIELGEALPAYPEDKRKDEFLVRGCQSRVWLYPNLNQEQLEFLADSDTAMTKGLIAILVRVFSGHTPEEISKSSLEFIEKIGLQKFLSMNRRNGLASMVQLLMNYASSSQAKG